jgi:hypothetical protein
MPKIPSALLISDAPFSRMDLCFAKTNRPTRMPWLSRCCSIFSHNENPLLGPSLLRPIGSADSGRVTNGNRCWLAAQEKCLSCSPFVTMMKTSNFGKFYHRGASVISCW